MPHPNALDQWDYLLSTVPSSQTNTSQASSSSQPDHIGSLPIEIFTEVVKLAVQDPDTTPLIISHVSKQWRDVMHNIAPFWDVLVLTHHRPREKTRFWMERTQGRLKELCVRSSAVIPKETKLWSDLLRNVDWGHLRVLRVEKWEVVKFLRKIGEFKSLDNLETLEIDSANPLESFPSSIYNSTASKLQNLIILSSSSSRFQNTPFQVRRLLSLSLSNVKRPLECLFALLKLNPSLEYLSLSHVSYGSLSSDKVTMNCLKTLRIDCFFPGAIFAVNMPNLDTIQIENQTESSRFDSGLYRYSMDAMRTPLGHTRLSKIILRRCDTIGTVHNAHDEGLIWLLQSSPNLQQLEISHTSCDMNFVIELLASTYSPPWASKTTTNEIPVCPNLTHLDFTGCLELETGPVLRMVKSRLAARNRPFNGEEEGDCAPPNHLSKEIFSLVLDSCPHIDPGWVGWLMNHVPHVSWRV